MGTALILGTLHSWLIVAAFAAEEGARSGGGIKGWFVGIGLSLVGGIAVKYLSNKGVEAIIGWQIKTIIGKLYEDSGDEAWEMFEADMVLAIAKLAQAKYPKDGLGPERRRFLVNLFTSKVPIFKGREQALEDILKKLVDKERNALAEIKGKALARQRQLESQKRLPPAPL